MRSVHAVVVTYNSMDTAPRCIERLLASEGIDDLRVTVVDNASRDGGAAALVDRFPSIEVVADRVNVGFAAAVNRAVTDSASRWIAVVNPDVEVHPDTLAATVEHLEHRPAVGSCGAPAVHADGTVSDRTFFMKPTGWSEITRALGAHRLAPASRLWNPEQSLAHQQADEPLGVDVIADCFNVIDRELFEHLGGYDEDYFLCGEDLDLSIRTVEAEPAPRSLQPPILHRSASSFSSGPTPGSPICGAGPSTSTAGGRHRPRSPASSDGPRCWVGSGCSGSCARAVATSWRTCGPGATSGPT